MPGCDLCGKELGFFSTKVPIKYNHGTRTVCKGCFADVERTDVQFEDFCTGKRFLCFIAVYGPVMLVFIIGMVAIGVTQCSSSSSDGETSRRDDRSTGCFLGMFLFGFFGGFLGVLMTPMMFWTLTYGCHQQQRQEAAYKVLEAQRGVGGGVVVGGAVVGRPVVASAQFVALPTPNCVVVQQSQPVIEQRVLSEKERSLQSTSFVAAGSSHGMLDDAMLLQKASAPGLDGQPPVAPSSAVGSSDASKLTGDDAAQCIVCMEAPRTTAFTPCGHVACCKTCSNLIVDKKCPICRQTIAQIIELHIS